MLQDVRQAVRHLLRSPAFAVTALIILSLGIGTNSAMFSLMNALVLRPLPIKDPQSLIGVSGRNTEQQLRLTPIPAVDVLERTDGPLEDLCGYNGGVVLAVESRGAIAHTIGALVTGRCFRTFGVPPILGRVIDEADAPLQSAGNRVAVISHRLWLRLFARDASAIGQSLRLEGGELLVIGVMPEGFSGLHADSGVDIFTPFDTIFPARTDRRPGASHLIGRLRPGTTFEAAASQLTAQWSSLLEQVVPATLGAAERESLLRARPRVERIGTGISFYRDRYARPATLMFGLTAILMLLACVNLGGLSLARAIERGPELATRLALGGSRWRVSRQMLVESLALSIAGSALAVPVAFAIVALIVSFMPGTFVDPIRPFTPDSRTIAVTLAAGVLAGFVIGVLPIWLAGPGRALNPGGNRTIARSTGNWTRGLVVIQVGLSVVMVVGAGLLARSLYLLQQVDPGVRAEGVIVVRLTPLPDGYRGIDNASYYPDLVDRIAALTGVQSVGYGRVFPRLAVDTPGESIAFAGREYEEMRAMWEVASPTFFDTLDIPLLRGRAGTWADNAESRAVAVVSERLARTLTPDGDVIGRRVRYGINPLNQDVEIVGVVRNATMGNPRRTDMPMIYRPPLQVGLTANYPSLVIRVDERLRSAVITGVRQAVDLGGREFVQDVSALDDLLARAPSSERMSATLAGTLAALAVVLSFAGIFGLLAYSVTRRTREIGVRAAVGAEPSTVLRMVMREGLVLTTLGVVIGLPAAYAGSRVLGFLTFGITPTDPTTFGAAVVLFVAIGVAAGIVPARRAARIDPAVALRLE
ncbi:MAG: ADOP family duplicated permease [Acidobacteriota bacterium]|nr:ADOP family duplicated permease [Acidobacteriota bacterium]